MSNFEVLYETKEHFSFLLTKKEEIQVSVDTMLVGDRWIWTYYGSVRNKGGGNFLIKNQKFKESIKHCSKGKVKEMNDAFYELVGTIKHHPDYRLRLMSILNDEVRQIWDRV